MEQYKNCLICDIKFTKDDKGKNFPSIKTCSRKCGIKLFRRNCIKRSNEYIIGNKITKLFIRGIKTLVDTEDVGRIQNYCWGIDGKGYVYKHKSLDEPRYSLQRFLLNPPGNMVVDHRNHNKKDNRRINLRIVSQSVNLLNKSFFSRNTSGTIGVHKGYKGYRARFQFGDIKKEINFLTKEEAVKQREKWEKEFLSVGRLTSAKL